MRLDTNHHTYEENPVMPYLRRATGASHFTASAPTLQVLHTTDTYDEEHDIDWIAVECAAEGTADPNTLTKAEITAAVHHMTDRGLSQRVIAERLGIYDRKVTRIRARRLHNPTPANSYKAGA